MLQSDTDLQTDGEHEKRQRTQQRYGRFLPRETVESASSFSRKSTRKPGSNGRGSATQRRGGIRDRPGTFDERSDLEVGSGR